MKIEPGCLCLVINSPTAGKIVTAVKFEGTKKIQYICGNKAKEDNLWSITNEDIRKMNPNLVYVEQEKNLIRLDDKTFKQEFEKEKELVK